MQTELKYLGKTIREPVKDLEAIPCPGDVQSVVFSTDEFTSLCPVTGQPDFVTVTIEICPRGWSIESKSLKLYLWSFRNEAHFNEALAQLIAEEIQAVVQATYTRVTCDQKPRGGISLKSVAVVYHKEHSENDEIPYP